MSKTVTLRLSDEEYEKFSSAAGSVKRSLSNLISFLALRKLEEDSFVDELEMEEILANPVLTKRLKRGAAEAREMKGSFVDV
ncbi:MAG: hypothetical protein L3J03_09550 [Desulfobacterales bacterium]|nr:hypothetical protein [Desulfobacterales bacterium]